MYICNFVGIYSILLKYANIDKGKLYAQIFYSYGVSISGDASNFEDYKAGKVLSGDKKPSRELINFYADLENRASLLDDLEDKILPFVSDKYAMCEEIHDLIISDGMCETDREQLLKFYPKEDDDIADYLRQVIIFTLNRPSGAGAGSPPMSERIIIPQMPVCKYFCGREKELQAFSEMLETHEKVFICGVGGIGKSEFAKKFAKDPKSKFTNILFVTYSESLKNTVAGINFKSDKSEDTVERRYSEHLKYLQIMKNDTLIIIDNFDIFPDDDENFNDIMALNCKIIFTTRSHLDNEFDIFELSDIDENSFFEIAEKLSVTDIEKETLSEIFAALHYHTLACELILRLLKKSAFTAEELLKKIITEHVNLDITDKIRKNTSATYYEHIHRLFRLFALTEEQKNVMRLLSLAPINGISDEYFLQLSGMENMNAINELDEIGLVRYDEHIIAVHPLIGEAAAADFVPDMNNCRPFLDTLILEFQHHLYEPINFMRQEVILEIADRIVEYTLKNDTEYYFYFLINACPYAEVFEDVGRMKFYISEMENVLPEISDKLSLAVFYMCKAAYTLITKNDVAIAFNYTKLAQRNIPDVTDGGIYSRREIDLCFNVCNNLGKFYFEHGDFMDAKEYYEKALAVFNSCNGIISTAAVMQLNDNMRELTEAIDNQK